MIDLIESTQQAQKHMQGIILTNLEHISIHSANFRGRNTHIGRQIFNASFLTGKW